MNLNKIKPKLNFTTIEEAKRFYDHGCKEDFTKDEAPCIYCHGTKFVDRGLGGGYDCEACKNGKISVNEFRRYYYEPERKKYIKEFEQWRHDNNIFKKLWNNLNKEERDVLSKLLKI